MNHAWSSNSDYFKMAGSLSSSIENHEYMGNQTPSSFWEQWNSSSLPPDMGLDFDIPLLSNYTNISTNLTTPTVEPREPTPESNQYQGCCEDAESSPTINSNTTLCSLACQWVIQCNTKGVELDVLYFRMEHGFKQGNNPLEGCRVDNQVLLEVLTEIS
ncbi:unnamed protein product [Penicillium nalgiovense]|uniref:Uncharacterized protein n=1 Tax=Penicillium nalgiovense TaxID=60175 RepID=A0A9W4H9F6_PENNA|nr:unnamed protein product [Penicillium nalgiovense]CAG7939308.1 unnamed protein product [Penicillium nalgiovense]CAG7941888.1 unnamed protein product [Penicillium nalgiovense]CAG7942464.1 unnamed protein product [Penicillium nalgiovense]CAG7958129.1 unnamed protein product [Penicillium nalgiovense]